MRNARHAKLFLVPAPSKPTKSECPKCDSKKVLVHHNADWGTWFDWFTCEQCGHEWEKTDEKFPGRVINLRILPPIETGRKAPLF
jgi:hypothetical protein